MGERTGVLLRREGDAGCAAAPWRSALLERLSLRAVLEGWCWWVWWAPVSRSFSRGCDERLLVVLCDQRLMFAAPSRNWPMAPSACWLAALERRLAAGGGVARWWSVWGLGGSGFGGVSLSDSEAARLTVTTDDDEMDVLRDEVRRCLGAGSGCCSGSAAGVLCIFILPACWQRPEPAQWGSCLRTNDTLCSAGCRHAAGAGTRAGQAAGGGCGRGTAVTGVLRLLCIVVCSLRSHPRRRESELRHTDGAKTLPQVGQGYFGAGPGPLALMHCCPCRLAARKRRRLNA